MNDRTSTPRHARQSRTRAPRPTATFLTRGVQFPGRTFVGRMVFRGDSAAGWRDSEGVAERGEPCAKVEAESPEKERVAGRMSEKEKGRGANKRVSWRKREKSG